MLFAARAFVAALVTAVPLSAQSQTIATFDAPGAGHGTFPQTINPGGRDCGILL
jgi:hypothetical protein